MTPAVDFTIAGGVLATDFPFYNESNIRINDISNPCNVISLDLFASLKVIVSSNISFPDTISLLILTVLCTDSLLKLSFR